MLEGCVRSGIGFSIGVILSFFGVCWAQERPQEIYLEWERDNARLAQQFVLIATTPEYLSDKATHYVSKWRIPIILGFKGSTKSSWRKHTAKHIILLNSLGVNIKIQDKSRNVANMIVHFESRNRFNKRISKNWPANNLPGCFGLYSFIVSNASKGEINTSNIYIPNDLETSKIYECIEEEITQSLGLLNDSYELLDSLFNDENLYDRLSNTDKLFVKLLYSPEITPGMSDRNLYKKVLSLLNKIRPNYKSNKPFDYNHQVKILNWINLVRKTATSYSSRNGKSNVKNLLAVSKNIDPTRVLEAISHNHYFFYYLGLNMNEDALFHAKEAYNIISKLVHPNSLRYANSLYNYAIALRLNNKIPESKVLLSKAKYIINSYWYGNKMMDKITIREIGMLLKDRRFSLAVDLSNKYLESSKSILNLNKMNILYLQGLANLGKGNIIESRKTFDKIVSIKNNLRKIEQDTGSIIISSYSLHLNKVLNNLDTYNTSVKNNIIAN